MNDITIAFLKLLPIITASIIIMGLLFFVIIRGEREGDDTPDPGVSCQQVLAHIYHCPDCYDKWIEGRNKQ